MTDHSNNRDDTWANNASVLAMATVILTKGRMPAMQKGRLITNTGNIIQPDVSAALTKVGTGFSRLSCSTVHSSAHHLSISDVPVIITYCSPLAVMLNLNSTGTSIRAVDKPQRWDTWGQAHSCYKYSIATLAMKHSHRHLWHSNLVHFCAWTVQIKPNYIIYIFINTFWHVLHICSRMKTLRSFSFPFLLSEKSQ